MHHLGLLLATCSALSYALSNALQHQAAGKVEQGHNFAGLWLRFARSPQWVVGTLLGVVGLGLHLAALSQAEIAVVQPFMILSVVMAVPLRAAVARRAPTRAEMTLVGIASLGLLMVVNSLSPLDTERLPPGALNGVVAVSLAALVASVMLVWRVLPAENRRGFLLAVLGGLMFGGVAAAGKALGVVVGDDPQAVVTSPALYLLLLFGTAGFLANQSSYHYAPLAVTLPVANILAVLEATVLGMVFFDEIPAHDVLALIGTTVGLAFILVALRLTATVTESDPGGVAGMPDGLLEAAETLFTGHIPGQETLPDRDGRAVQEPEAR